MTQSARETSKPDSRQTKKAQLIKLLQAKSGKAASDRTRILSALARAPSTTDSLEARLALSHQTCSARVHGLNKDGLIADSTRRERTRAGRQAIVWEVTPKGREALRGVNRG